MDNTVSKKRSRNKNTLEPASGEALCPTLLDIIREARSTKDDSYARMDQAMARSGRARSTIYKDMSAGIFPTQVEIGEQAVGWKNSELSAWMSAREFATRSKGKVDMKKFIVTLIALRELPRSVLPDRCEHCSHERLLRLPNAKYKASAPEPTSNE